MKMEIKTFRLRVIDIDTEGKGTFTGRLPIFNVEDSNGSKILPGAFTRTLKDNNRFPLLNNRNPEDILGDFSAAEDKRGLVIKGFLDLGNKKAKEKYYFLNRKIIRGFSIGFDVIGKKYKQGTLCVSELRLWEGSFETFPAIYYAAKTEFLIERLAEMIRELKSRPYLSDKTKEMIHEARNGFNALLGDFEPLQIGNGPIDTLEVEGKPQNMSEKLKI